MILPNAQKLCCLVMTYLKADLMPVPSPHCFKTRNVLKTKDLQKSTLGRRYSYDAKIPRLECSSPGHKKLLKALFRCKYCRFRQ